MTTRDFAFWLQGFFEISNAETISKEQTDMIKKHLNLVFFHEIDPSYTSDPVKQEEMNHLHNTGKPPIVPPFNATSHFGATGPDGQFVRC